jgi:CRP-like cAMP-binding protein
MPDRRSLIGQMTGYLKLLREHPIFRELPEDALKTLVVGADFLEFAPNEVMLRQGDVSDSVLLLTAGEADVFIDTGHGALERGQLAAGALIGEVGVFADLPRTASVRARTTVEGLRIARDDILAIGGNHPAFLRAVLKLLGERIAAINQAIAIYTDAMVRLEEQDFDVRSFALQARPLSEMVNFGEAFRRLAERIGLGARRGG